MALSDTEVEAIHLKEFGYVATGLGQFARAVEAEVRKQDDELIRQLVEALQGSISITMGKIERRNTALIAGLAWLERGTQACK